MAKRFPHGYFITVEGPEGCGKSTQIPHMVRWLKRQGLRVRLVREPGGTKLGEEIRKILLFGKHQKMSVLSELFLFLAARAQLVDEVIFPALSRGEVVISDRFFDSTVVYQGMAGGLGRDVVERLAGFGARGIKPNLTFFIDIDHRLGLKRAGRTDRMEKKGFAFHGKVAAGFRELARRHHRRAVVIDGSKDRETVREHIEHELKRIFA